MLMLQSQRCSKARKVLTILVCPICIGRTNFSTATFDDNSQASSDWKKKSKWRTLSISSLLLVSLNVQQHCISLLHYQNLTLETEFVLVFLRWGAFPNFKHCAAPLAHQHQVCSCSAAKPIQQWVPASKRTNLLPSHHIPSKHH